MLSPSANFRNTSRLHQHSNNSAKTASPTSRTQFTLLSKSKISHLLSNNDNVCCDERRRRSPHSSSTPTLANVKPRTSHLELVQPLHSGRSACLRPCRNHVEPCRSRQQCIHQLPKGGGWWTSILVACSSVHVVYITASRYSMNHLLKPPSSHQHHLPPQDIVPNQHKHSHHAFQSITFRLQSLGGDFNVQACHDWPPTARSQSRSRSSHTHACD